MRCPVYGLQYVFQSFCRLHRAVSVFAVGAGQLCLRRRAGRIPAGGGRQSAQQLLLFAGQIVFLFLYFFIKLLTGEYRITPGRFGRLAFESLLGVALGCLFLWPAVLCLKDNPRTVDLSSGFGFLLYGRVQQYFAILASLFLPPDPTYLPNIFTDAVVKHTSMTAFLPVVSCAGVWAYMKARRKSAFTKIMWACLIMALVPVLNSAFYALNSSYYARWYYMPILIMCAATMQALQDEEIDLMEGLWPVAVVTLLFAVFALVPKQEDGVWSLGVVKEQSQFWLTYLTAVLGLLIFYGVIRWCRGHERFTRVLLAGILGFSVFYSVAHIALGKFPQWEGDANYRSECYVAARNNDLPDDHFTESIPTTVTITSACGWKNRAFSSSTAWSHRPSWIFTPVWV